MNRKSSSTHEEARTPKDNDVMGIITRIRREAVGGCRGGKITYEEAGSNRTPKFGHRVKWPDTAEGSVGEVLVLLCCMLPTCPGGIRARLRTNNVN